MTVPVNMVEICIAESWTGTVSMLDQHYIYTSQWSVHAKWTLNNDIWS